MTDVAHVVLFYLYNCKKVVCLLTHFTRAYDSVLAQKLGKINKANIVLCAFYVNLVEKSYT